MQLCLTMCDMEACILVTKLLNCNYSFQMVFDTCYILLYLVNSKLKVGDIRVHKFVAFHSEEDRIIEQTSPHVGKL